MRARTLACETDLMLCRLAGSVSRGDGYWVGTWPGEPTYLWGNLLVMDEPPEDGDLEGWLWLADEELGADHYSFAFDDPSGARGDIEPFVEDGFEVFDNETLVGGDIARPPRANTDVTVRALATDAEWAAAVDLECSVDPAPYTHAYMRAFSTTKFATYRRMCKQAGAWFGAFAEGRMLATCGIFVVDGLARFQSVHTHPDARRRGICGRLVADVGRFALDELGARQLVITAETGSSAAQIYASCGLQRTEVVAGCVRRPPGLVEAPS